MCAKRMMRRIGRAIAMSVAPTYLSHRTRSFFKRQFFAEWQLGFVNRAQRPLFVVGARKDDFLVREMTIA
jgi:hypothetical protein